MQQTPPTSPATLDTFLCGAGLNVALTALAGMLASFMLPPREVWWFSGLFLVPLLIALRRTTALRAAAWLMLLFGLVFFACSLSWLRTIFGFSVVGIYALASLPLLLFGLLYRGLAGAVSRCKFPLVGALAMIALTPVCWLAVDWIRCEGWYFQFSWAQFGFSFASARNSGALYALIGVYGVTFLIMLLNAVAAEIVLATVKWPQKLLAFTIAVLLVLPLGLYLNRPVGIPNEEDERTNAVRVAIVQHEMGSFDTLVSNTHRVARWKPDIILWPEYAVIDYPLSNSEQLAKLQALARSLHATLILGCKKDVAEGTHVDPLRRRAMMTMDGKLFANIALLIGPDGNVLGDYQKTHPIQFFSDGVPGRGYPTFATPVGRVGVAICYDLDFASTFQRLAANGAELLVVPTFDAADWSPLQHDQHARMAQARAAEVGRWVLRATSSGVSQVINPSGFVVASIANGEDTATMGIAVPRSERTAYVRWGYRLPHLCVALTALVALALLLAGWRRRYGVATSSSTSPSPTSIAE